MIRARLPASPPVARTVSRRTENQHQNGWGRRICREMRKDKGLVVVCIGIMLLVLLQASRMTKKRSRTLARPGLKINTVSNIKDRLELRDRRAETNISRCLHTKQGKHTVSDSSGSVCKRNQISKDGCCTHSITPRHSCNTCHPALSCCLSYEYCVSCCMRPPENKTASTSWRERPKPEEFEMFMECESRCRTRSKILLHGNKYRHQFKHCYWQEGGEEPLLPDDVTQPTFIVGEKGSSCDNTCGQHSLRCHEDYLKIANTCEVVSRQVSCSSCKLKEGPAAPAQLSSGQCVVNKEDRHLDCRGQEEGARRMCVCIRKNEVYL